MHDSQSLEGGGVEKVIKCKIINGRSHSRKNIFLVTEIIFHANEMSLHLLRLNILNYSLAICLPLLLSFWMHV